jgi:DNA invertase Pin-like site-specific DNA recombinase
MLCSIGTHRKAVWSRPLAAIAEFERELIKERTGDGRNRATANGVKFGRKPNMSDHQRQEAIRRRAEGKTPASMPSTSA